MKQLIRIFSSACFYSLALLMILGIVTTASATNGYFSHGYSVQNKGLAGAGTALPTDTLTAATNPAAMVYVGNRADVGLAVFNPNREYTVTGTAGHLDLGTVKSDSKWFFIPYFGFNKMLSDKNSISLSVYGNGGMNTDYDKATYPGAGASNPTGVDLAQLFLAPSYALKVHSNHAFGVSAIVAYQVFEVQGLAPFAGLSQNGNKVTNNGHEDAFGFGGRIGYYGQILPGLSIGVSYQTKINMTKFHDYEGLFAEEGDFDIPANWNAGIAYKPIPELTLVFDVQQIFYSDVDSVGNPFNPAFNTCNAAVMGGANPATVSQCLGGNSGVGFGWDDMTIYKFGVQYQGRPDLTLRAGYSFGQQPIPDKEVLFNIIAPGVIEQHVTAGITKTIGEKQELNLALMHAFSNDISGKNPLFPAQTIELKMNQWELTAGYSWKF
ncbi:MAG: hypothetical protein C4538_10135 [Nitrospiraceae bacterium]|nr:MAG: hypothetical protein C4538_10135 [Nitrospiraceae bacterium]